MRTLSGLSTIRSFIGPQTQTAACAAVAFKFICISTARKSTSRTGGQVFLDARLLALQFAQVIQLARTHVTATLDRHRVDDRAVRLEHALDAEAVRDLAHGEGGVDAGVLLGDDHAFVGLHALAIAFLDLDVDDDRVARAEVRQLAGGLFGFEFLQELVHGCTAEERYALVIWGSGLPQLIRGPL